MKVLVAFVALATVGVLAMVVAPPAEAKPMGAARAAIGTR